jgi:hypothetical protein
MNFLFLELKVTYKEEVRKLHTTQCLVLRKVVLSGTVLTTVYYSVHEEIIAYFILYGAKIEGLAASF